MTRECHVRFCERLRVKLPRPTYQVSSTFIFLVGLFSDVLVEYFHEPTDVMQAWPPLID